MQQGKTVLLLEDDAILRKQLGRLLGRMGFQPTLTDCVRDFEAAADQGAYDAILVDVSLPDGDGIEAFERVRSRCGGIPGVAMTANDSHDVRARAVAAGMTALLSKPVAVPALVQYLA